MRVKKAWRGIAAIHPEVSLRMVQAEDRRANVVAARNHLCFQLWVIGEGVSSIWIGKKLNNRHHTSIIYCATQHLKTAHGLAAKSRNDMRKAIGLAVAS